MINSLKGIVSGKINESLYLSSGDIEWEIAMPLNDLEELKINSECRVFVWLYHRDDQMRLFGFINDTRRNTFLELLKVDGIGPKGALKILSGIGQDELIRALDEGDLTRLEGVPGLGKKTAAKMLLALKGKLVSVQDTVSATTPYNDLILALTSMGYERRAASEALAFGDATVQGNLSKEEREKLIFREAISRLSS